MGGANITVNWTYPDNGPVADNYTVSLSVGEPVTTTELIATIEEVPYDQPLTGSVVATNCIGSGSPASLEGICKWFTCAILTMLRSCSLIYSAYTSDVCVCPPSMRF